MSGAHFGIVGSGASSGVPSLQCVLRTDAFAKGGRCSVCEDALTRPDSHNNRGNVSALLDFERPEGGGRYTVLIDCGKTFREALMRSFPRLRAQFVDALLLSHHHMDAMAGLDDLREIRRHPRVDAKGVRVKSPRLPIYCDATTLARARAMFPYLFSSKGATFTADVAFVEVTPWVPFLLEGSGGVVCTPIPVEHSGPLWAPHMPDGGEACLAFEFGAIVRPPPAMPAAAPAAAPADAVEGPSASLSGVVADSPAAAAGVGAAPSAALPSGSPPSGSRIAWVSDIRALSGEVRAWLASRPLDLLFLDALEPWAHPTHFCVAQALAMLLDVRPVRARLVGMAHGVHHAAWSARLAAWTSRLPSVDPSFATAPDWAFGFDGEGLHGLTLCTAYPSLEAVQEEVERVRAAARAACAADTTDYFSAVRRVVDPYAALQANETAGVAAPVQHVAAPSAASGGGGAGAAGGAGALPEADGAAGAALAATAPRWREDYWTAVETDPRLSDWPEAVAPRGLH